MNSPYFCLLHAGIPPERLKALEQDSQFQGTSSFKKYLGLLKGRVPTPPKAYVCPKFLTEIKQKPTGATIAQLDQVVSQIEELTHKKFGGLENFLLLTVKGDFSGSIRNLGICPENLSALLYYHGPSVAYGLYVDFLESFSSLVLGASFIDFRKEFCIFTDRTKEVDGLSREKEQDFIKKVRNYQALVSKSIGRNFPERPEQQLLATLLYFAKSHQASRPDEIFLQAQSLKSDYGKSVKGVVYTRHPFSGGRDLYGVFQFGPENKKLPLESNESGSDGSLKNKFPEIYSELTRFVPKIETCFRDVMEVEFVSDEEGHLFATEFHRAETTARAAVIAAIDLNREGIINDKEAALRIKPVDIETLLHPTLDNESKSALKDLGSTGVTAAPGTAVGAVFFSMQKVIEFHKEAVANKRDSRAILITDELLISDTPGLGIIQGLATKASGIASHAAVMARANGIPCIVGYQGLEVDVEKGQCIVNGQVVTSGTVITLDGGTEGKLYLGEGRVTNTSFQTGIIKDVTQLIGRVRKVEKIPLEVRVNINNPKDAEVGLGFGADGVGLCRTENMFMEEAALREIRNIVFSPDLKQCEASFRALEEQQFHDFKKIFEVMGSRVVNIRLMDLPLHDFSPQSEEGFKELIAQLPHLSENHIRLTAASLREHNPMLGLRASRYGLIRPEVYDLQIRAIVRAAYSLVDRNIEVKPGIMFPLVLLETELVELLERVLRIEEEVREHLGISDTVRIHFKVGSMIELPGAALSADKLARVGEFFAFGTNDLTQTTMGMSRDDSAHYLPQYLEKNLLASDPFKVLSEPVRELIETAVRRGKRVRADVNFGICGEQGGDPKTLRFCLNRQVDYVSCSPFRVLPVQVSLIQTYFELSSEADENGGREFRAA